MFWIIVIIIFLVIGHISSQNEKKKEDEANKKAISQQKIDLVGSHRSLPRKSPTKESKQKPIQSQVPSTRMPIQDVIPALRKDRKKLKDLLPAIHSASEQIEPKPASKLAAKPEPKTEPKTEPYPDPTGEIEPKPIDYEALEELIEFLNDEDKLKANPLAQAIVTRRISSILHFTQVDNLESIARLGICSVSTMRERRVRYLHNDDMRLDGRLNGISLSITHPNSLMFYKYRMASSSKWAILELAPAVIIDHDCRFCFTNAASSQIRALSDEELTGISAFERMFDGAVKANCPTDVQAEVLCLADIPTSYIKTVYVENSWYQRQIEKLNLPFPVQVKKSLFGKRSH